MAPDETRAYLAELRRSEDQFYRTVLNETETYMLAIRLVRAIADSLKSVADLETLINRFQRTGSDYVIPIADALETPQVMVLDYQLALAAAFYLRAQEIQEERARADLHSKLSAARAQGQAWVSLYAHEQKRYGKSFFQRLDLRVADGLTLRYGNELDMEKGVVFALEPLWLDLDTGKPVQTIPLPQPPQEFPNREALLAAVAAFREKYP